MTKVDVNVIQESDFTLISVVGELDASSSVELDTRLQQCIDNGETKLLIDCVGLTYISSAGIGVFTSRLDDVQLKNISMVLFNVAENIKSVFEILGVDQFLNLASNKEEAIQTL
ncbi:STAS domain-containing protein [Flammeovirga yaeyamensis]|uniref:Anti-sigma factor antagonist n=1 Tax=Flammeovirga yaeyamensis TaxID=367791 RepID=A0AAX1N819_9BACT|nr:MULTISPECIES: STAS domain-containing protein [Flammeovirga]ANQ50408.1 STAS domain-containing protein [Flammeovirga sp. MY04]MBB3699635.1 anti-sigma B factor antagonist [Flammeovirga yaeyamensis]NMF36794.1 STAS domain-containing protein [Flammeovirga yaeyamensis]QWG02167.1 STAS domain-containing protein [Flammeovirga yaeyamensis]